MDINIIASFQPFQTQQLPTVRLLRVAMQHIFTPKMMVQFLRVQINNGLLIAVNYKLIMTLKDFLTLFLTLLISKYIDRRYFLLHVLIFKQTSCYCL